MSKTFLFSCFQNTRRANFYFFEIFQNFSMFLAIVRVCSFAWISSAVIAIEGRTWFQANNCLVSYCVRYNSILRLFSQVAVTWCVLLLCELIGLSRDSLHCPRYRISNTTKFLQEQFKFAALPSSLVLKLITNLFKLINWGKIKFQCVSGSPRRPEFTPSSQPSSRRVLIEHWF